MESIGYTIAHTSNTLATRVYFGYGIILDKAAVLAACRAHPGHLQAMRAGTQFQPVIDVNNDRDVWEYVMAFWGEHEAYNAAHGTRVVQFTSADDRLVAFDDPVRLAEEEGVEKPSTACLIEIGKRAEPHSPEALRGYLEHMGVRQDVEPGLLIMSS